MANDPLREDWEDGIGLKVDSPFLNELDGTVNEAVEDIADIEAAEVARTGGAAVATGENTTSTTYVKLATVTDRVTLNVGPMRMVLAYVQFQINTATVNGTAIFASIAASGANTVAAADARSINIGNNASGNTPFFGWLVFTPADLPNQGATVFDLMYRVTGGTMGAKARVLAMWAL